MVLEVEMLINATLFELQRGFLLISFIFFCNCLVDKINCEIAILRVKFIFHAKCKIKPPVLRSEWYFIFRQPYQCSFSELRCKSIEQIVELVNWEGKKNQYEYKGDCCPEGCFILIFTIPSEIYTLTKKIQSLKAITGFSPAWFFLHLFVFGDLWFFLRPRFHLSCWDPWRVPTWRVINGW